MVDQNTQVPEEITNTDVAPEAAAPEAAAPETAAPQDETPAELNLNDLAAIRSIIDAASSRGAFKTAEMVAVGTVYNKLDSFLNQATKAQANA